MIATEELRRLLDGCGATVDEMIYPDRRFAFRVVGSDAEIILDNSYGKTGRFAVFNLTPEQAVEATLGRGTCRFEWSLADNGWADHTCSECGYRENTDIHVSLGWHYCPNCGRRIEVDA